MFMKKTLVALLLLLLTSSCISIVGLTDGYKRLSKEQKERCVDYDQLSPEAISKIGSDNRVYSISAASLKEALIKSDKRYQLVYEFNPECTHEACIPISLFVSNCQEYDVEPYVLSRYYAETLFNQSLIPAVLYVMDYRLYQSRYVFKYAPKFIWDLTNGAVDENDTKSEPYNMFLYEHGKFVKAFSGANYLKELKLL